ncbi:hypothetical protein ANN_09588 [Periplaneta americana]|uniref:Reverse transcriptase domain-containing protein n=1 Tax=Periplaneta americana TaxID=6978 RepID=A0ABQ8TLP9_PERAM|nr:hypothetical protein ANN_09588 [Periplaneta americana]
MSEEDEIRREVSQECPLSLTLFNIYLEDLVKNCFQDIGGVIVGGRKIKCTRFADDMVFLAEEEMILRVMLLELNDNCEQYGMNINPNKTKTMVIRRKIKKVNLRIRNEAVDQVDSFRYLGCTISSNMRCCQEVKRRIAMAKEAFNRKRSILCELLEKKRRAARIVTTRARRRPAPDAAHFHSCKPHTMRLHCCKKKCIIDLTTAFYIESSS